MVRFLPIAAAGATGILVGSAMVATRFVIHQTAPASLALSPITAAGLGAFLLGENISMMLFLGLACVVFGLWIAHWEGHMVGTP